MKRKTVTIVAVAVLLVLVLGQLGSAADNGVERDGKFAKVFGNCWAELSDEEQQQVKVAFKDFKEKKETLREEFKTKQNDLREQYLENLPEEARIKMGNKENVCKRRHRGKGCGPHCPGGCFEFGKRE